jgi:hypothetical protein
MTVSEILRVFSANYLKVRIGKPSLVAKGTTASMAESGSREKLYPCGHGLKAA